MKKTTVLFLTMTVIMSVLSGCQQNTSTDNSSELNNGVSAIEDAMSQTAPPNKEGRRKGNE